MKNARKIDLENYTKGNSKIINGVHWYTDKNGKPVQTVESHRRKNVNRMIVNGKIIHKYINKQPNKRKGDLNPLHKPGNYKSLDDAYSHNELDEMAKDKNVKGELYIATRPEFEKKGWFKIGMSVNSAESRLKNYQTGSPFQDYYLVDKKAVTNVADEERKMHRYIKQFCDKKSNEWFKIDKNKLLKLFNEKKGE